MMKKEPNINKELLEAWLAGECTDAEKKAVEHWLRESPANIGFIQKLAEPDMDSLAFFDRQKVKASLLEKISHDSADETMYERNDIEPAITEWSHPKVVEMWNRNKTMRAAWWFRAAAIVMVIATAGIAAWLHEGVNSTDELIYREVTSPVRTITTLTLSDGTHVELNANSTLRYPEKFTGGEREVYLEGEAFFHVVSDEESTFKVYSGELATTVLGTKFNVNYIQDLDRIDISLVEGSVLVEASGQNHQVSPVTLEPDQWVSYSGNQESMNVLEGIGTKLLWREGILQFEDDTLLEVASTLEKWYGVPIEVEDTAARDARVTGTFQDVSLEHILETLTFVAGIEYTIEKNENNDIDKVILNFTF